MTITILSQPGCQPCNLTHNKFEKAGVETTVVNIREDASAAQRGIDLGYTGTPIVLVEKDGELVDHWSQFRLDKINEYS